MRVLFVASEGLPYSKTGGLADVVEALPKALVAMGHEVAVLLPRYHRVRPDAKTIRTIDLTMGAATRSCTIVDGARPHGVQYFLASQKGSISNTILPERMRASVASSRTVSRSTGLTSAAKHG